MKLELDKLKYELDEKELRKIKRIEKITGVDYEITGNQIPLDSLPIMVMDLLWVINNLQEELELKDTEYEYEYDYTDYMNDKITGVFD